MEQTVNTFGKGLLMDTNPMVQGNETLSNALNATFVTMNGNEVILQNDMGNRRVDNAYLPSGYEPVGIKEYGGVIYLALYNPITNRSQIGSFPSPERNIGGENVDGLLSELWLDRAITEKLSFEENGIHYLNGDTLLTLLSNDTSLHAGDKFTVYCDSIWNSAVSELISNFNLQTYRDKRRKFTLSLGVLNSLNEFVDITHTLKRFDKNKMLNDDDFESEEERFNTGYFISKSAPSTTQLDRDKVAANTYAYKLVGPLYIKNEISHFNDFSYTLEVGKNEDNKITLVFTGTATCNYLFNYLSNHVFDVRIKKGNNIEKIDPSEITIEPREPGENSYTQVAKYTFEASGEITYYIDVFGTESNNTIYYLKDLSDYGTLNTEYINSNVCKFTGWRYSVDPINKKCHISYSFEAYPSSTTTFDDLKIKISENTITDDTLPIPGLNPIIYTGRRDFVYEYSLDRKVLNVLISYNNNGTLVTIKRFILTTELFNPCYSPSSEDYVPDYGLFMYNESSYKENDYTEEFKRKLHKIKNRYLTVTPIINGEIKAESTPKTVEKFDTFVPSELLLGENITCYIKTEQTIYVLTDLLKLNIEDENLYPIYVKLSDDSSIITPSETSLNVSDFNKDNVCNNNITLEYKPSSYSDNLNKTDLIDDVSILQETSTITLTYYDKFRAKAVSAANKTISKLFVNLNSDLAIEKYIKGLTNSNSGWSLHIYEGSKLHHWWRLWINSNNTSDWDHGYSRGMECNERNFENREFDLTSDLSEWFDEDGNFNSAHLEMCTACSGNTIPFICATNLPHGENVYFVDNTNMSAENIRRSPKMGEYCKVWLVNTAGTLTILENKANPQITQSVDGIFRSGNTLEKEIAIFIGTDRDGNPYVVPVENVSLNGMYYPSNEYYIYNNRYSFDFPINVNVTKNNITLDNLDGNILKFKVPEGEITTTTKSITLNFSSDSNFNEKVQSILQEDIFNKPIYIETGKIIENTANNILKCDKNTKEISIANLAPFLLLNGRLICTKISIETLSYKKNVLVNLSPSNYVVALRLLKVPVLKKEHML